MRIGGVVLVAACSGGKAHPATPLPASPGSSAPAARKACPENAVELVAPTYPDEHAIRISACAWGNFAGPGWMIVHFVPPAPMSEAGTDGGVAFVAASGKLVASVNGAGSEDADARAIDLDGDGVDELLVRTRWHADMAPISGESLRVMRVTGTTIEDLADLTTSYRVLGPSSEYRCTGSVATQSETTGRGKQIVVVTQVTGESKLGDERCLAQGRHVFHLRGNELRED